MQRRPGPGTGQDAFRLHAEVIELKEKPSMPIGTRNEDAFGHRPAFANRGAVERALLNMGHEDVTLEGLTPLDPRFRVLGGSSDDLVLDVDGMADALRVGDIVSFSLNYSALLAVMMSQSVEKRPLHRQNGY